jgi:hypothetical protein
MPQYPLQPPRRRRAIPVRPGTCVDPLVVTCIVVRALDRRLVSVHPFPREARMQTASTEPSLEYTACKTRKEGLPRAQMVFATPVEGLCHGCTRSLSKHKPAFESGFNPCQNASTCRECTETSIDKNDLGVNHHPRISSPDHHPIGLLILHIRTFFDVVATRIHAITKWLVIPYVPGMRVGTVSTRPSTGG